MLYKRGSHRAAAGASFRMLVVKASARLCRSAGDLEGKHSSFGSVLRWFLASTGKNNSHTDLILNHNAWPLGCFTWPGN